MAENDTASSKQLVIPLTKGFQAVISVEDIALTQFKWSAMIGRNGRVYAHRSIEGGKKKIYLGRAVLEARLGRPLEKGESRLHIDGDSLNNTRENLGIKISKKLAQERLKSSKL
jgi:hypothetical protein